MITDRVIHRKLEVITPTRRVVTGIIFLVIGFAIWFLFAYHVNPKDVAVFGLNPGGSTAILPNWYVPVSVTLYFLSALCGLFGMIQIVRGFKRWTNRILSLIITFFVFSFLVWATAGKSLNLAGLIVITLGRSVPLTLGAISGILCERAGVVNIAIEGMMLMGAMVACMVGSASNSLWLGLLSGIAAGMLLATVHAVLSIKYKTNQIISGTVINILAVGLTSYLSQKFLQVYQVELNSPPLFPSFAIPVLSDIPLIGPIFFKANIFVYAMYLALIIVTIALFYTRWGLRMRAVGEHPKAADTLGINVFKTRYISVLLGGAIAGLAGSYFTLASVGRFDPKMTNGRGFIALAAMIFGNWTPIGSFGAGLLFGFAESLDKGVQILNVGIPSEFLLMAPYIVTMVILAGVVGRSVAPAADGVPYEKE